MDIAAFSQRRGVYLVGTLLVVSLFIFALTEILPGDVATMILGRTAPPGGFSIR